MRLTQTTNTTSNEKKCFRKKCKINWMQYKIRKKKKTMKTKQSKICMATGNIYKTIIQFSDYIISFGFKNIYTIAHTFSVVSVLIKMESTERRLRNANEKSNNANVSCLAKNRSNEANEEGGALKEMQR